MALSALPLTVVVRQVGVQDLFKVAAADDEQVVEALVADGANPAFGDRVCLWCLQRRFDYTYAFGVDDRVERPAELRVSIVDQEPLLLQPLVDCEVPRLLCYPGTVRV